LVDFGSVYSYPQWADRPDDRLEPPVAQALGEVGETGPIGFDDEEDRASVGCRG
jgi:hypothetical protein